MSLIQLEHSNGIATVRLNRPDKLNALSEEMKIDLIRIFSEASADETVRVVLLTAVGRGFCAGGDTSTMGGLSPHGAMKRLRQAQEVVRRLASIDKPVVAAVRGPVAGIGWSLALASDMIIASETANFHQAFSKIGVIPDGGSVFFLKQVLGSYRAKELVYTARRVEAKEALSMGLVNSVVPDAELEAAAIELAGRLAAGPGFALSVTKRMFRSVEMPSLDNFLDAEAWAQSLTILTEDHQEGLKAFREKRAPDFKNR